MANNIKHFVISVALLFSELAFAQQWCPPSAEWSYSYYETGVGLGYLKVKYEKDTILLNHACKKLLVNGLVLKNYPDDYDTINRLGPYFTYANPDSVFFWNDDQKIFSLTYNFNVKKGDTISTYQYGCGPDDRVIVDSTGTMEINNRSLRYYVASKIDFPDTITMVERIGTYDNFIFPAFYCTLAADYFSFRCYQDDSIGLVKLGTTDCDYIYTVTSISTVIPPLSISLSPNPSTQSFQLQISELPSGKIYFQLFDALGREVKRQNISNTVTSLNRNNLSNGLYFWQVIADDKILKRGKLVLE